MYANHSAMFSDEEIERTMLGRGAAIFLGLTAALSIWAIVLYFWDINLAQLSRSQFEAISWGGAAAAIGVAFLLAGMWLYWIKFDRSSKRARRIWFFVLLIGFHYGALPYYVFVYLPAVRRRFLEREGRATS
jgi:hypothetical protein